MKSYSTFENMQHVLLLQINQSVWVEKIQTNVKWPGRYPAIQNHHRFCPFSPINLNLIREYSENSLVSLFYLQRI